MLGFTLLVKLYLLFFCPVMLHQRTDSNAHLKHPAADGWRIITQLHYMRWLVPARAFQVYPGKSACACGYLRVARGGGIDSDIASSA